MTPDELYQLKFPIGEFTPPAYIPTSLISTWIAIIEEFPNDLKIATSNLSLTQKNWKYRPGGWSLKQIVHHCADSHVNAFIRFKLSLTENTPTIRPYFEDKWAEMIDGKDDDLKDSIGLITSLHSKWSKLLKNLKNSDYEKTYVHPEYGKSFQLDEVIGTYAWHCQHHLTHIKLALDAEGKYD
ncbi:YfiT family bacillithiol transferase [Aquimarina agarivorans]|uniref:YfiT family bacillithiol transferase n=1 Tax=Aquimarina agarivorans TaxID=980584 RepID=UPI000248E87F|nr:putative metal-dependent hydrolase [Aquimarina agarivorans]